MEEIEALPGAILREVFDFEELPQKAIKKQRRRRFNNVFRTTSKNLEKPEK